MSKTSRNIALAVTLTTTMLFGATAVTSISDGWTVNISYDGKTAAIQVPRPEIYEVKNEEVVLKEYRPNTGGWLRGTAPKGIRTQETTSRFMLIADSMKVTSSTAADAIIYENGKDYQLTPDWGTVGRLPNGRIQANQKVYLSYNHAKRRLDSIVLDASGNIVFRRGTPHPATPEQPQIAAGELRLANVWMDGNVEKLDNDVNVYPLSEQSFPELPPQSPCVAERLIPKTYAKLIKGEKVKILAWGDSVTVGTFVPDPAKQRWQAQVLTRFQQQFPKADIVMETEAWGGRNTNSYFNVPAGQPHNYKETVLDKRPDLIISEFVNDGGFNREMTYKNYSRIRDDLKAIGVEWIILTPHYVRPDWMGLKSEKNVDDDPRVYVKSVREFAAENNIALADASMRYGRLWRRGIPASSLMMNTINHPNPFGMSLFADAIMALFR